ncbi:hypothetical protein N7519_011341 [Penicillium mononematosum]|uniref:uncharacterized protein n=1 Tax=Penicillium mononematosum TaxID=268346 RepID=UPI0025490BDD|nr:uncharacterized protein N7519_011341 [Penicillium mononematosum]KAJ6180880.1 hypothetical protein N7519_011341 [Penicillium mononematosum]
MRLATWLTFAFAAFAASAGAQNMPECAANCLAKSLKDSSCTATDAECICADNTLVANVEACSLRACTVIEGLQSQNATATLCQWPVRDKSLAVDSITVISIVRFSGLLKYSTTSNMTYKAEPYPSQRLL